MPLPMLSSLKTRPTAVTYERQRQSDMSMVCLEEIARGDGSSSSLLSPTPEVKGQGHRSLEKVVTLFSVCLRAPSLSITLRTPSELDTQSTESNAHSLCALISQLLCLRAGTLDQSRQAADLSDHRLLRSWFPVSMPY